MKKLFAEHRALAFILFAGIILRSWHLGWGLPDVYEEATPAMIGLKLWNWNLPGITLNPHFFNYPALIFYINFAAQGVCYWIGHILGYYQTPEALAASPTAIALTGRMISVVFDTGTIGAAFVLVRKLSNKPTALIAAILVAINPLLIREAHLIQVDTPLTFFSVLATIFLVNVYRTGEIRWYFLAGIATGLAASSKYTGAVILLALVAVHMMRYGSLRRAFRSLLELKLYAGIAAAGIVFFILNPYVLLDFREFYDGFSFEEEHISTGHLGVNPEQSTLFFYLLDVLPSALGWIMALLAAGTTVMMVARRDREKIVLLAFPVIYFIIVSLWKMRVDRYILPIIPLVVAVGAIGISLVWEKIRPGFLKRLEGNEWLSRTGISMGMIVLVIVCSVEPAVATVRYLRPLGLPDTRALTREWILQHIPKGSVIASGPYGIDFPPSQYFTLQIPFLGFESERVVPFYDTRWYEDVDLLIASDYDYTRYASEPQRYADFLAYYDSLRTHWKLDLAMEPSQDRTGPAFWLYSYPDSLKQPRLDPSIFGRLEASPESTRISNFLKQLNEVYLKKGKLQKSEQVLLEILSVEVDNLPLMNMLAEIELNLGEYEQALKPLMRSAQLKPDQPEIFAMAGHALLELKHYREAAPTLLKAISLNNKLASPYEDLITVYRTAHDRGDLLAILKQYAALLPPKSPKFKEIQKQIADLGGG
ncbi:MAG TPA: glycosyltransferase family 39 protein [Bacteroidota bacterium]|nr:glycosyltransferase family 39 protein [Bacteroidota bacterium]